MRQWYEKSAAQGNAHGQLLLGILSVQGKGVPHDYKKALLWIRLAVDQGLHDAQHFLGLTYENGKGVSRDLIQAHKWYILAGVNGLEIADTDQWASIVIVRGGNKKAELLPQAAPHR